MPPEQLSTAAVRRLIEMAGADRVGDDAVEELGKILEDLAVKVGKEATGLAETRWQENCESSRYSTSYQTNPTAVSSIQEPTRERCIRSQGSAAKRRLVYVTCHSAGHVNAVRYACQRCDSS